MIKNVIKVIYMKNIFKKYFGDIVSLHEIEEKPHIALFLAKRRMFQVNIDGISFILIEIAPDDKFPVTALKKQMEIYENSLRSPVAFSFDFISRMQRDSLIRKQIPFVAGPDQIYLPFLGMILSNRFRLPREVNKEKMMPVTQQLFLYLLYQKENSAVKYLAAKDLQCTCTSITRASDQLSAMGLIRQEKTGKEIRMYLKSIPSKAIQMAKPYLINPVQKRLTVCRSALEGNLLYAGETALSEYSMLNPPRITEAAVYKADVDKKSLCEIDPRWVEPDTLVTIELWKYNPSFFAVSGKVDPVSLACSLQDRADERIETAIDEMMEELIW